jgi:N-hydroxyarylamine O-acetyltransferase
MSEVTVALPDGVVATYLDRLGLPRSAAALPEALRTLHLAHLEQIPFENLSVPLGEPVDLDLEVLAAKVLGRGRGGFCYELNGLFAHLLTALGYRVTLLAARVWTGQLWGPPLDHLTLRVICADGTHWLADVGFGEHSRFPLRADERGGQHDPNGRFRLVTPEGGDRDIDVLRDDVPQYRIEPHPRMLADFTAMSWYQTHSPDSHFTRSTICSRQTADGRVSISGSKLIQTEHGVRTETPLPDAATLAHAYARHFGVRWAADEVERISRFDPARLD